MKWQKYPFFFLIPGKYCTEFDERPYSGCQLILTIYILSFFIDKEHSKPSHIPSECALSAWQDYLGSLLLLCKLRSKVMKADFPISSEDIGTVLLIRKMIAKALCWWLGENGIISNMSFL